MAQYSVLDPAPDIVLTFRPFIDYLKKRRDESNDSKSRFFY
jgi:hypothetical protein